MLPRPILHAAALAALTAVVVGCLHAESEPEHPSGEEPASVAGSFDERGTTVTVRAWSCDGLYGRWEARVRVTGLVRGRGADSFRARRGEEAVVADEFPVRIAGVAATADLELRVRVTAESVVARGVVSVETFLRSVETEIDEALPIRRGAIRECR